MSAEDQMDEVTEEQIRAEMKKPVDETRFYSTEVPIDRDMGRSEEEEEEAEPSEAPEPSPAPPEDDLATKQAELDRQIQGIVADRQAKRKQAEELSELKEKMAEFMQSQAAKAEQAPAPPSPDEDPVGFIDHRLRTLDEKLAKLSEGAEQTQNLTRQQQAERQLLGQIDQRVRQSIGNDEAKASQYAAAMQHGISVLRATAANLGADNPDAQAYQTGVAMMAQAIDQGRDPVEFVTEYARSVGWTGQAPAQEQPAQPSSQAQSGIPNKPKQVRSLSSSSAGSQGSAADTIGPDNFGSQPDSVVRKLMQPENKQLWDRLMAGQSISAGQIA